MEDLKDMLGFAPNRYYYYMWKYISPLMLLSLLIASIVNMGLSPPGYNAWMEDKVKKKKEESQIKEYTNIILEVFGFHFFQYSLLFNGWYCFYAGIFKIYVLFDPKYVCFFCF